MLSRYNVSLGIVAHLSVEKQIPIHRDLCWPNRFRKDRLDLGESNNAPQNSRGLRKRHPICQSAPSAFAMRCALHGAMSRSRELLHRYMSNNSELATWSLLI